MLPQDGSKMFWGVLCNYCYSSKCNYYSPAADDADPAAYYTVMNRPNHKISIVYSREYFWFQAIENSGFDMVVS